MTQQIPIVHILNKKMKTGSLTQEDVERFQVELSEKMEQHIPLSVEEQTVLAYFNGNLSIVTPSQLTLALLYGM